MIFHTVHCHSVADSLCLKSLLWVEYQLYSFHGNEHASKRQLYVNKMVLTKEDQILIKNLFLLKGYGAKRLIKAFPTKNWKMTTLNDFLKWLRDTGSAERQAGSGRPRTARTDENINTVDEIVLSQEDTPQSHHTRLIARETGIHHSSVFRIIRQDLRLKCVKKRRAQTLTTANCVSRLTRARQSLRKFPQSAGNFIFFSDERIFAIGAPVKRQNDRIYAAEGVKKRDIPAKRLLRTRPTFSKSLMVSVAVSKLGCTELIFMGAWHESGRRILPWCATVAVHASCYPSPGVRCIRLPAGQCTSPPHTINSRSCVMRRQISFHQTCGRHVVLTWIPLIIKSMAACRSACTRNRFVIWLNWSSNLLRSGLTWNRRLWMRPLTSGGNDSKPASRPKDNILSIYYNFSRTCRLLVPTFFRY